MQRRIPLAAVRHQSVHVVMNAKQATTLLAIAKQHLGLDTFDTRKSDALDFHDLAVWNIRAALEAAYKAGEQAAQRRKS